MNARNSQAEPLVPIASRSKLPARRPSVMIETSISSEPTQRVDEEARRRLDAPLAAPDAHQEGERDQHRLEADVEQHQVARREQQHQRRHEQQREREVAAAAPAGPEAEREAPGRDERDEAAEHQREAVEPDVVAEADVRDPAVRLLELHAADRRGSARRRRRGRRSGSRAPRTRASPAARRSIGRKPITIDARQRHEPEERRRPAVHAGHVHQTPLPTNHTASAPMPKANMTA